MFRLKAFGTLALEGTTGPVPAGATQKRRLALLALVASHGPAGIPRERAAVLLWPESNTESSRHSLSQLLYSVRQSLRADPFVSASGNLKLDPGIMTSDLDDLDAAIRENDAARISAVYTGKFLEGFSLPDSDEFERWMETERAHRHARVRAALERHATQLTAGGHDNEAAEWWKKLAALEPVDSRIAVSLMKSLDAAGNRPGALQHANIHSNLVREELGIEPDPVVAQLERHLRTPGSGTRPVDVSVVESTAVSAPASAPLIEETPSVTAEHRSRSRINRRTIAGIATLAAAAIFVFVLMARRESRSSPVNGTAIAVLPFSIHSDSSIEYLREGLVGLLSSGLDGAGDLRAVDPRALLKYSAAHPDVDDRTHAASVARHFNAHLVVLGDAAEAGGKLRISAGLFNPRAPNAPLSTATVEGDRSRLFALVDELAATLLASRYKGPRERLTKSAAVTTQSLPALKEYLNGEQEFRAGHYSRAVEAFEKATALDTTFALAYYRMSVAAEWEGRPDLQKKGAASALRFSSHLSDHDRKLVEAFAARRNRNPDKAEAIYRQIVREFPDDTEAWFQLGEVLFHDNAIRGRPFTESREAWEQVLKFVPGDADALLHLTRVLARTGPPSVFDSVVTSALPFVTPDQRIETETLRAFTVRSQRIQDSIITKLAAAGPDVMWQSMWRLAIYGRNLDGAERIGRILAQPEQPPPSRAIGHNALMLLLLAEGKLTASRIEGASVQRTFPWSKDVGYIYFPLLGFGRNDSAALARLRSSFHAWKPVVVDESQINSNPPGAMPNHVRAYSAGLLSVMLGETDAADRYAREVERLRAPETAGSLPQFLATVIRAAALRKQGKSRDALTLLENWRGTLPIEVSGALGVEAYYGWLRAELLNETGRDLEALRWYETRSDLFMSDIIYLGPSLYRAGAIYEKLGNRTKAVSAYRAFVDLWKNADPELQPFVTTARERLRSITATSPEMH